MIKRLRACLLTFGLPMFLITVAWDWKDPGGPFMALFEGFGYGIVGSITICFFEYLFVRPADVPGARE